MNTHFINAAGKSDKEIYEEVSTLSNAVCIVHNVDAENVENLENQLTKNTKRKTYSQFSTVEPKPSDIFLIDHHHEFICNGYQIVKKNKKPFDFSDIIESSLNEIYIFSLDDYKFEFVNQGALTNLGFTMDQMSQMTPIDIKPRITKEDFEELIRPLLDKEKDRLVFKTLHQRADKSCYEAEVHLQLMQQGDMSFFTAIVIDITQWEIVNKESALLNDRLGIATKAAKMGVWTYDIEADIMSWDEKMLQLHKVDSFDGKLESYKNSIVENDREWVMQSIFDNIHDEKTTEFDFQYRIASGTREKYVNAKAAIQRVNGIAKNITGVLWDITDQKKKQAELTRITNKLQLATKAAKLGIWTWNLKSGQVVWDNQMKRLFGRDDFDGNIDSFAKMIHPDDVEKLFEAVDDQIKRNKELNYSFRIVKPDGEIAFIKAMASLENIDGRELLIGVNWDITEDRQAEQELKEKNERLALLEKFIDQSSDSIQVSDEEGNLIYINNTASKRLGITKEDVGKYTVGDFEKIFVENLTWEGHIRELKAMDNISIESVNYNLETGEPIPVEVRVTYQEIHGKGYVIANSRDVSERKIVEKQLKASEQKFRFIAENTSDGIMVFEEGRISYSSHAYNEILGYSASENLKHDREFIYNIVHPEDREPIFKLLDKSQKKQEPSITYQFRVKHKEGHYIWREDTANFFYDESGKQIKTILVARDITERKRNEIALRESEEMLKSIADNIPGMIWRYFKGKDGSERVDYLSKGAEDLFETEVEKLTNHVDEIWKLVHPEDVALLIESVDKSALDLSSWKHEYRIVTPEGKVKWISATGRPKKCDDGCVMWHNIALDITDRKNAEIQLAESEEVLSNIADNIPGAIWRYILFPNGSDRIEYMSKGTENIWELSTEELQKNNRPLWEMIHPEDLAGVIDSINKSNQTLTPWKHEYRIVMTDGRVKWLSAAGQPKRLKDGTINWHSMALDVTDKKKAEIELEKTLKHLNLSIETGKMGIWELDINTGYLDWNDQMFEIFGVKKAEFDNSVNTFKKLVHPDDVQITNEALKNLARGKTLSNTQFRIIRPDGQKRHVTVTGKPSSYDENGKLEKYIGINIDVSHIAEYQEQLKATLKDKDALFKELHHRIKNNLQMVSSLLFIKSTMTDDISLKRFIDETSTKIHSVSSIHEQLLQMQGVNELEVKDYLESLCRTLIQTYSYGDSQFELETNLAALKLNIDKVLNLGLIVNELLSNAMKYAYPKGEAGIIEVILKHENNESTLIVSDFGVGISNDKMTNLTSSYGMQLINIFTRQIGGTVDINNSEGTRFVIKFPTYG